MNAIECAVKMEEEAKHHYEELATAAAVPELKEIFNLLAAAEEEHHTALLKLQRNTGTRKSGFTAMDNAVCLFKPILDKRDLMETLERDPDAYMSVIKEEEESVRFYEELANEACDEESRMVLNLLAAEEKKHLDMVENIYDFVERPRTYLAWGEFSNLKEY
jgi:rubrerythrin